MEGFVIMSSYEVSNGGGSLLPSVIVIILVVTSIGVIVGMNSFQGTTNNDNRKHDIKY